MHVPHPKAMGWQPSPAPMYDTQPWVYPYGGDWLPGPGAALRLSPFPPLRAMFDGKPKKLAFFLNQAWTQLNQHGGEYADDETCVDVIVANLKGKEAKWVKILHDEGAPELPNLDVLPCELRAQFGDPMQIQ